MILSFVKPFLFVLILPVIKGGAQYLITGKVSGVLSLEAIAAAVVLLLAFLSFRAFRVSVDGEKMTLRRGFLLKTVAVIRKDRLSSVSAARGIADLVFGSVTYRVNTEAGASGRTDFKFKLRLKDAGEVSGLLYGEESGAFMRFGRRATAVFAAATSSAVTGLLVGVPVINNSGRILGIALSGILFNGISRASSRFDAYFPPAVNLLTVTLVAGYLLSFLISFVKTLGFGLSVGRDKIRIKCGVLTRQHTLFKKSAVNDVCIEQTPIMRPFGIFSMRAAVGGYGDRRGEKAVIVPAARYGEVKELLKDCFPGFYPDAEPIKPERTKKSAARFLLPARAYAALDVCVTALAAFAFPAVSRLFAAIGSAVMAVIAYYGCLCLVNRRRGGLLIGERVFASGSAGLTLRELYCAGKNLGEIKITRTPADRLLGTCNAEITVRSESADRIKVRNVSFSETLRQIEKTFNISE